MNEYHQQHERFVLVDRANSVIKTFASENEIVDHFKTFILPHEILGLIEYHSRSKFVHDEFYLKKLIAAMESITAEAVANKLQGT